MDSREEGRSDLDRERPDEGTGMELGDAVSSWRGSTYLLGVELGPMLEERRDEGRGIALDTSGCEMRVAVCTVACKSRRFCKRPAIFAILEPRVAFARDTRLEAGRPESD